MRTSRNCNARRADTRSVFVQCAQASISYQRLLDTASGRPRESFSLASMALHDATSALPPPDLSVSVEEWHSIQTARPNVLLIGPEAATSRVLNSLLLLCRPPVSRCHGTILDSTSGLRRNARPASRESFERQRPKPFASVVCAGQLCNPGHCNRIVTILPAR